MALKEGRVDIPLTDQSKEWRKKYLKIVKKLEYLDGNKTNQNDEILKILKDIKY